MKYLAVLLFVFGALSSCQKDDDCWTCREKVKVLVMDYSGDQIDTLEADTFWRNDQKFCFGLPEPRSVDYWDGNINTRRTYWYVCGK